MSDTPKSRGLSAASRARALEVARKSADRRRVGAASKPAAEVKTPAIRDLADFKKMKALDRVSEVLGLENPYFRLHEGHASTTTVIDDKTVLNFSSYDYLGLNADPRPGEAAQAAIRQYGVSALASRMVAGERPVHRDLETGLAKLYGSEEALVFVSGHATNISLIGALMREGDLILHDSYIHNSVTTGVQLSSAARRSFAHNDLESLERMLEHSRASYKNVLVVVEGLYSMDGDLPDLPALIELKKRYGFWLMVDEAHSLGCVGNSGKGSFEHFGSDPSNVDIWMGTLSKTLASTGGYVAGSKDLIDFLKAYAPGFVFSVALPPVLAASALCALKMMNAEPWRAGKLHENADFFQKRAAELGLDTGLGQGYGVMPVMIGDSAKATKLSQRLLEQGVNVAPVTFPGVPMQMARLRFFLSTAHTTVQIETALSTTKAELDRLDDEKFEDSIADLVFQLKLDKI